MNSMPSCTSFSREIISPQINSVGASFTAYRFQQTLTTVSGTGTGQNGASWPGVGTSNAQGIAAFGVAGLQQDPSLASMLVNYQDTRTVAMSVRIQCTQAALTAQGFVHMAVVPEDLSGSALWQYPTSYSAMERAPFYQKVPLANLINNTPTIALPIMDEGAWRYRNTALLPSQVGTSFLQQITSTGNVQVTYAANNAYSSGTGTVSFQYPFVATPSIQIEDFTSGTGEYSSNITASSATGFTANFVQDSGGSAALSGWSGTFNYSATGEMTAANAALYYASVGSAVPITAAGIQSVSIPGIETTYGWGAIIIALENVGGYVAGNNVSPIEVEIIRHYEAIPNDTAGNIVTANAAAPPSQAMLEANKTVQMTVGPISILPDSGLDTAKESKFMSTAQRALQWGANMGSSLGAAGLPWAGAVGSVMGMAARAFVSFFLNS